ncbi:unnamed protein product [Scytosiphon promiscuus]
MGMPPAVTEMERSVAEAARARVWEVLEQRLSAEGRAGAGAGAVELASISKVAEEAPAEDGTELAEMSPEVPEADEVARDWAGPSAAEGTEGEGAVVSESTGDADLIDFSEEPEAEASEDDDDDDAQADVDLIDFSGETEEAEGGGDGDESADARADLIDLFGPVGAEEGEGDDAPVPHVPSETAPDATTTDEADPARPVSVLEGGVGEGPTGIEGAAEGGKSGAAAVDSEQPVTPWGPLALVSDKADEGVCPMPASRDSSWAKKPSKPQPRCSKKHAIPWRRNPNPVSRPRAPAGGAAAEEEEETWLELVEVAEDGKGDGEVDGTDDVDRDTGSDAGQGEEAVEMGPAAAEEKLPAPQVLARTIESKEQLDALPAFLRPGGGMAPVAFLTGCRAAKMAPGASKKCKSMPLLLGYTGRNVIELVEPGVGGKVLWRSRKSLVKVAKQSVGSRISSWFRGKKSPAEAATPPQAIAGLYLRETHTRQLALMMTNKEGGGNSVGPAQEDGGHADSNGDDGREGENESGSGGETGYPRSAGARGQGPDRVEFGVVLEGGSVSGTEKAPASASKQAQEMGGSTGKGGTDLDGDAEIEMRETRVTGGPPRDKEESEEKFAAMLIPGGRLCVFGTRGGVRCMSHGVHRWVTHVSGEGSMPQGN